MKRTVLLLGAMLLLLTSGCNFSQTSIDSLIKPPTLSKVQQEIYAALSGDVDNNKNINLVYPKNGEYRSPYVIENLDEEETDEALVFYRLSNSAVNANHSLNINVLDQKDGKWLSAWVTKELDVSDIDKLNFITVKDKKYIVMGFHLSLETLNTRDSSDTRDPLNAETLNVFEYQDGKLSLLLSERCMAYEVYDMDGDGVDEIVAMVKGINNKTQTDGITAKLFHEQNGTFVEQFESKMEASTTEFFAMAKGKIGSSPALYVDGVRGSESFTEILTIKEGKLENLTYNTYLNLYQRTARLNGLICTDVDKDQNYEIPKNIAFAGYEPNQLYRVQWYDYVDGELEAGMSTYTDYAFDYHFFLPARWDEAVTAKKDSVNNEITFFLYQGNDLKDESKKLLKIRTFTSSNLGSETGQIPAGYRLLSTNGQFIYGYTLETTGTEYDLTDQEVKDAFEQL